MKSFNKNVTSQMKAIALFKFKSKGNLYQQWLMEN